MGTFKNVACDVNSRVELDEPDRKHSGGDWVATAKWVLSGARENDLSVNATQYTLKKRWLRLSKRKTKKWLTLLIVEKTGTGGPGTGGLGQPTSKRDGQLDVS